MTEPNIGHDVAALFTPDLVAALIAVRAEHADDPRPCEMCGDVAATREDFCGGDGCSGVAVCDGCTCTNITGCVDSGKCQSTNCAW